MSSSPLLPLAPIALAVLAMNDSDRAHSYVCRVMGVTGFGGRRDGEVILLTFDPKRAEKWTMLGSLLGGGADARIYAAIESTGTSRNTVTISVPIDDDDAVAAGLACGGTAELLLEPLELVPVAFWEAVVSRARVGLVSSLRSEGQVGESFASRCVVVDEHSSIALPALPDGVAQAVGEQLRKAMVRAQIIEDNGLQWFCEVVTPLPHLAVIGVSALATAITNQAALLGWTVTVIDERIETGLADCEALARSLGTADALVVLSHDLEASCGALQVAAKKSLGHPYLGALGSRHTQAARAARLADMHGWSAEALATIHGPVGLDIGSRTPEEIALAIVAEIVAHQRNRTASSLSIGKGPISAG
jgi:xanthine dehydrogenase accessory factor